MGGLYTDPEREWEKIEREFINKDNSDKSIEKKKKWDNPLQEKYSELRSKYARKYRSNDGSPECEKLIDDMRAFERVFSVMNWRRNPKD